MTDSPARDVEPLTAEEEASLRRFVRWPGPIWVDVNSTVLLGYLGQLLATLDAARADTALPWERPTREGHLQTPEGPDDYCTGCGELWPCSFEQGWAARADTAGIDAAESALRGVAHDVWGCNGLHVELEEGIRALAAALRTPKPEGDREAVRRCEDCGHDWALHLTGPCSACVCQAFLR